MVGDPIGLVWGRAQSYIFFGKRVCEMEAFIGTMGVWGGYGVVWGAVGSVGSAWGWSFSWASSHWVVDLIELVEGWLIDPIVLIDPIELTP